jgi:predicted RND superfamily exporter protein
VARPRPLTSRPSDPGLSLQLTGIGALWLELLDYIVKSEIESFLYAFALIGAMMCFIFRSLAHGDAVDDSERMADPA